MDFAPTAKVSALRRKLTEFMERFVYPNERTKRRGCAPNWAPCNPTQPAAFLAESADEESH